MNVEFFESINLPPPNDKIYLRLGYSKGKTKLSQAELIKFESYIDFALDKIKLQGAAVIASIKEKTDSEIILEDNLIIKSNSIRKFLNDCESVLFMGATTGFEIMAAISSGEDKKELEKSVVADAVASEMVDAALGWIADYKARILRRENKFITQQRFSAGYGDFDLTYQKVIYNILNLAKFGVKLTESYMLKPEKTVTALCGIKQP
jgi:cobalamin-dependent methionine synthase I